MNERPPHHDSALRSCAMFDRGGEDAPAGNFELDGRTPEARFREVALRLRPSAGLPSPALPERDVPLFNLLAAGPEAARRLRIAYMLRREGPLEIGLAVTIPVKAAADAVAATPPVTRRALELMARVALPGFAPVAPTRKPLDGPVVSLRPQRLVLSATPGGDVPRPRAITQAPALALPMGDAPNPSIDSALIGLAEAGCNADLVLDLTLSPLTAAALRVLVEARRHLIAATHAPDAIAAVEAQAALAKVGRWLRAEGPVLRLHTALHMAACADPAEARLAQGLLFGASVTTDRTEPGIDLSSCVLPRVTMPSLCVHPLAVTAIARLARQRRPRPPRGAAVLRLGVDDLGRDVTVASDDLRQHAYVVGQTGTGKSTLLKTLALADASAGVPLCVIDPHGDLHADLVETLPRGVMQRAIIADAGDFDAPFSLNILEVRGPYAAIQRNFIANQLIALFKTVYGANPGAFGPVFEQFFRSSLFLLMDAGGPEASLVDLERVFGDHAYRKALLDRCSDPTVVSFWKNIAHRAGGDLSIDNVSAYITSKLAQISANPLVRPIVCARHTTLDLPGALAEGRTVLVNLAKGLIGGPDAAILGGIITIRLFAAAMARASVPAAQRGLTRVILDEFQTYGSHGLLSEAMAEVRKYGLSLVLANQSVAQIGGRASDVAHAILGNTGNLAVFRVGPKDASILAEWLGPEVEPQTLMRLPNHSCVVRLLQDGVPLIPTMNHRRKTG